MRAAPGRRGAHQLQHRPHARDHGVEVEDFRLEHLLAGEGEQLSGEVGGAVAGAEDRLEWAVPGVVGVEVRVAESDADRLAGERIAAIAFGEDTVPTEPPPPSTDPNNVVYVACPERIEISRSVRYRSTTSA